MADITRLSTAKTSSGGGNPAAHSSPAVSSSAVPGPALVVLGRAQAPSLPTPMSTLLTGCDLVPVGDGSYRAIPRRLKDKITVKEAVQLTSYSRDTIYRLYRSGFVTGERLSPRKILLNTDSLQAHLEAIREPGFWTSERRAQYWGA